MKWIMTMILAAAMLLSLAACSVDKPAETTEAGTTELWVVKERYTDGLNSHIREMCREFEKTHEGVTIRLDILSTDAEERAVELDAMRTAIMAGDGPDVFLLPTDNRVYSSKVQSWESVEQLFPDVQISMRNGMFQDVSAYYDADEALNTSGLQKAVMDAGTLGEARYVLPLSFGFDVLVADTQRLEESGLDMERVLSGNILEIMEAALQSGEQGWACGAEPYSLGEESSLSYFSEVIDYETGSLNLTAEELADFLRIYQAVEALVAGEYEHKWTSYVYDYVTDNIHLGERKAPMIQGSLNSAVNMTAISMAEEREVTLIPVRSTEGNLIASVGFYGAVGAGCDTPELAYELLRTFLTEEAQCADYHFGFDNWPVRTGGTLEQTWEIIRIASKDIVAREEGQRPRKMKYLTVKLSEADFPVLNSQIDEVRFPISSIEREVFISIQEQLNEEDGTPTDADIDALAEKVIDDLIWHLAES